ncbi:hypothetical protein [Ancylobacter sp.]|uniref:hypothetical protein n=1 Tax=Ancylobacter sp. TaxID=1872567 RepID=UPI003D0F6508
MSGQEESARAERMAAALRENLKRRKQQARGRQAPAGVPSPMADVADVSSAAPDGDPDRREGEG